MSADGFSLDVGAAERVVSALGSIADDYAAAYRVFGAMAALGSGPSVWGAADANDANGAAPSVAQCWESFREAWGEVLDEGVGATVKIRQAVFGSVVDYRRGDEANAAELAGVIGRKDVFDLSEAKSLEAPDPATAGEDEAVRWGALGLTTDDPTRDVAAGMTDAVGGIVDEIGGVLPG